MALEAVVFRHLSTDLAEFEAPLTPPEYSRKRKRRRGHKRNTEEAESQRMTHIAVERNRRKQMNEYFALLRSLMPPSYAQKGDQASVVGGAVNFVKQLEQLLQSLELRRWLELRGDEIEVTLAEKHVSLKILCRRCPKQILRLVVGLQNLCLSVLHLNVTSFESIVLYSFCLKVEEDCRHTTVDDITGAVQQIVRSVHEEDEFYAFC